MSAQRDQLAAGISQAIYALAISIDSQHRMSRAPEAADARARAGLMLADVVFHTDDTPTPVPPPVREVLRTRDSLPCCKHCRHDRLPKGFVHVAPCSECRAERLADV